MTSDQPKIEPISLFVRGTITRDPLCLSHSYLESTAGFLWRTHKRCMLLWEETSLEAKRCATADFFSGSASGEIKRKPCTLSVLASPRVFYFDWNGNYVFISAVCCGAWHMSSLGHAGVAMWCPSKGLLYKMFRLNGLSVYYRETDFYPL